jgi:PIN domain nuclease of toxin-antitoxin system
VVLLDTHALLWWKAGSSRLTASALARVHQASTVLVSPISCWEVGMLVEKNRIKLDRPTSAWVRDLIDGDGVEVAELTPAIAVVAAELPEFPGDPADRFLYATARHRATPLLSKDRRLHTYAAADRSVTVLW